MKDIPTTLGTAGMRGFAALPRTWFLLGLTVVYGLTLWITDGLSQPVYRDEAHYLETTQFFVDRLPPSIEDLRSYPELTTPLAFLLWAYVESITGAGAFGARLFTMLLGAAILVLIAGRRGRVTTSSVAAAFGVAAFPYFVPLSVFAYTDTVAAFFVCLGFVSAARGWSVLAAISLALAVSTRQYMIVFPLAFLAWEVLPFGPRRGRRVSRALLWAAASSSLVVWYVIFGGRLSPAQGFEVWTDAQTAPSFLHPTHCGYVLACVGAYFVILETLLFRRWRMLRELSSRRGIMALGLVAILFSIAPPSYPGGVVGALDRVLHLGGDVVRMAALGVLAWIAVVRFSRLDLSFWLVWGHTALMAKALVPWDKYDLPLIVALWILSLEARAHESSPDDPPLGQATAA